MNAGSYAMKKRYLYALLFGAPGFCFSLLIAFTLFGAATGFLWIFVFGDNPWPAATAKLLPLLFVLTCLVLWIGSVIVGFVTGKKLETEPELNKKHIMISVDLTVAPILFMVLQQRGVGNLGPNNDSQICSDFCRQKGYSLSGMPPKNAGDRSCLCYDDSGQEILDVPMDKILPSE